MNKSNCPTGCKETAETLLSLYLVNDSNIDYEVLQRVMENVFGYTSTRVSTAVKFMHAHGKCLIYEDVYSTVIERAQILANNNIKHSITNEQIFK